MVIEFRYSMYILILFVLKMCKISLLWSNDMLLVLFYNIFLVFLRFLVFLLLVFFFLVFFLLVFFLLVFFFLPPLNNDCIDRNSSSFFLFISIILLSIYLSKLSNILSDICLICSGLIYVISLLYN